MRAIDRVCFAIEQGETFGLVGESGSGKTTTGRCILRLIEPTAGEVRFQAARTCWRLDRRALREARRHMQMVFQDPYSSLNPRMRVETIVEEPLVIHRIGTHGRARARGSPSCWRTSGSIRRCVAAIRTSSAAASASASAWRARWRLNPSLIIADEPVSALDVSIQAQVINLLVDLQAPLRADLSVHRARSAAGAPRLHARRRDVSRTDRRDGADRGRLRGAEHPYTRALLSAVPSPIPTRSTTRLELDRSTIVEGAALREIGPGHWAAV